MIFFFFSNTSIAQLHKFPPIRSRWKNKSFVCSSNHHHHHQDKTFLEHVCSVDMHCKKCTRCFVEKFPALKLENFHLYKKKKFQNLLLFTVQTKSHIKQRKKRRRRKAQEPWGLSRSKKREFSQLHVCTWTSLVQLTCLKAAYIFNFSTHTHTHKLIVKITVFN